MTCGVSEYQFNITRSYLRSPANHRRVSLSSANHHRASLDTVKHKQLSLQSANERTASQQPVKLNKERTPEQLANRERTSRNEKSANRERTYFSQSGKRPSTAKIHRNTDLDLMFGVKDSRKPGQMVAIVDYDKSTGIYYR